MIPLTLETSAPASTPRAERCQRLRSAFAKVEPHEAVSAVSLTLAVFSLPLLAIIRCWLWVVIGSSREHARRERMVSAC